MSIEFMATLMLISVATAAAGIVTVVLMLDNPPLSPSGLCAVLVLVLGSSAAAVYGYGWFSVAMGGPFPEVCEDRNSSGAELAGIEQEQWPLRSACVYSDGTAVEHVSMAVNVLVCVPAGLAVVVACVGAVLRRRARPHSEAVS
ncbi:MULTISPECIES: hypothetical protein [unclassified Streptomyces]|uniref:hypothetical protein n=1 Tax=unclassified Streptomyces TaxID=2593676 RepID=UPI0007ECADAE|nr:MULTISPECIES: hypothetical protein [unclassified Streptomyces]MCP3765818.1 hypothetical protein [Streptomyces sp. MAR25Y5]OBQ47894.1 hypothetical protein A4U61_21775 [Streptomyces sp. H-KF8]